MKEISLKACAKINLGLDVLRRREDGYHDLRMIMQSIRLFDRLTMRRTKAEGIRMKTNLPFLPVDRDNLVVRSCQLLMDEFNIREGVFVDLEKHIPVAAGLAGGSSDAAAAMIGINRLFDLGLSLQDLMSRGTAIGADVPFCLMRGTALAEGIGEQLTRLPSPPRCHVLLAKPDAHISTKYVYTHLDVGALKEHPDIDAQIRALKNRNLRALAQAMGNVLETVTLDICPQIGKIRELMLQGGAIGAMMSGSGPTVFGLFEDREAARRTLEELKTLEGLQTAVLTDMFLTDESSTHCREQQTKE